MTDRPEILVHTLDELEAVVSSLIAAGSFAKLIFGQSLLLEPRAWDILERLTTEHPNAQPPEEIVSYAEGDLEEKFYRGFTYKVTEDGEGFHAHVHQGCAGWWEPWNCTFQTLDDADLHARAHIDQAIAEIDAS
jgi:hypothetical protein